jgi:hypothetical protein
MRDLCGRQRGGLPLTRRGCPSARPLILIAVSRLTRQALRVHTGLRGGAEHGALGRGLTSIAARDGLAPTLVLITSIITAIVTAVFLVSCGTRLDRTTGGGTSPTGMTSQSTVAVDTPHRLVMIIRHGEKPDGSNPGVDTSGNPDDASLTHVGWNRARRLVDLFHPAQGAPRPGLAQPAAIYAAGANDSGEGRRTRETVQPLADELHITVNTTFGKGDEKALVGQLIAQPGPTLIAWQHGEIPAIADAFPAVTPPPPSVWPDNRFDVIWVLTETADGWHFTQLPELALPQDQATVITN